MSKFFSKLELKMVLRSLDWTKKHDPNKYESICSVLDREGIKYIFDGKKHIFVNEK